MLQSRSAEIQEGKHGDAREWTVPLGPPFLSFTGVEMNDRTFVTNSASLMANWLAVDRRTIIRALLGVPYVEGIKEWATNDFASKVVTIKQFMAWSKSPHSVIELAKVLEPVLVNLGIHLQSLDDPAVYSFIPILQWLDSRNLLSGMGRGLLGGIKGSR
jgi:hypothetical protein